MRKILLSLVLTLSFVTYAQNPPAQTSRVKIENVKVQILEKGKDPVTVTVPYWVAQASSELGDLLKVDEKDLDIKKILSTIEKAPKLGPIMTIEEKEKKIIISIE